MILVTGATGHLGRAVVSRLASLGHDVVAMVRDVQAASRRWRSSLARLYICRLELFSGYPHPLCRARIVPVVARAILSVSVVPIVMVRGNNLLRDFKMDDTTIDRDWRRRWQC